MWAIIWAGIRPGQSSPKRLSQSFQFHKSHVRRPQFSALKRDWSLFPSSSMDQTSGSGQHHFLAASDADSPLPSESLIDWNNFTLLQYFVTVFRLIFSLSAILSTGIPNLSCKRTFASALRDDIDRDSACSARARFGISLLAIASISVALKSLKALLPLTLHWNSL